MLSLSLLLLCSMSEAQNVFDEFEAEEESSSSVSSRSSKKVSSKKKKEKKADVKYLRELEKFKDIAVIQKKFLDKSKRLELWGAGSLALNSQFYDFLGFNGSLTYHFSEAFGVEVEGLILSDLEKNITSNLESEQNIITRSIVVPSDYYGLHLRWSPIYGKISLQEKTINPFEVYFTFGGGLTGTNDGQRVATIHVGSGQVYPITKNVTFKWTLSYNIFRANARTDLQGDVSGQEVQTGFLYLSAGFSIFLPFSKTR
jgi:outer membrane beta-barrel protein